MNIETSNTDTIGNIIKKWRIQKGWSQERLGKEVNLTQSAIYMLEKGKCKQTRKVVALSKVMGIPPHVLDNYDEHTHNIKQECIHRFNEMAEKFPDWRSLIAISSKYM